MTAVDANTHTPVTTFTGTVNIAEDSAIPIYTQNQDPSGLSPSVTISSGGTATFVAKSLAGPKTEGKNGAPPDPASIKTTNYPVDRGVSLVVPQWITSGRQIDPFADPTKLPYDWFQYRIKDIFRKATGFLPAVLDTISSYSLDGAIDPGAQTPGAWGQGTSPVVFNPYSTRFRLDSATGSLCGLPAPSHSLTDALYHEARHAYQFSLMRVINNIDNDEDHDYLVNIVAISPTDIIVDTTTLRDVCDEFDKTGHPVTQLKFNGPFIYDAYGNVRLSVPGVGHAIEMDANKFASQQ